MRYSVRTLVMLLSLAAACRSEDKKPEPAGRRDEPRTVQLSAEAAAAARLEVVAASRTTLRPTVPAAGFVQPDARRKVVVRAPGEGRVLRVAVDVGARVKKGDVLAILESPEATGAVARHRAAAAKAAEARRGLDRAERLLAIEAISRAERDTRRTESEGAEAEAAAARQELGRLGLDPAREDGLLVVAAPLSGTVLEVSAVDGGLVDKEADLAVVADLSQVWAVVETAERLAATIETAAPVDVRSDAQPDWSVSGRVALVEPTLDETAGRTRVRLVLDNAKGLLRPGLFVTADLPLTGSHTDTTTVPSSAIQRVSGITAVFVETAPNTFELRPVETGRESAGRVEIRQGLQGGERVVARGAFVLKSELLESTLRAEEEE